MSGDQLVKCGIHSIPDTMASVGGFSLSWGEEAEAGSAEGRGREGAERVSERASWWLKVFG